MLSFEEYNKDNLTIVIPNLSLMSNNFKFKNVIYQGCQFIAMNFQYYDNNLRDYLEMFNRNSFKFKFSSLMHQKIPVKKNSINSSIPILNSDLIIDTNYQFLEEIKNQDKKAYIVPYQNQNLKLINDNRTSKFSLNYNTSNSKLILQKGLNKQPGYVSFKIGNRYLTYKDCGCYLYFTKAPGQNIDETTKYNFNKSASFLALNHMQSKKGYNSFRVIKNDGKR